MPDDFFPARVLEAMLKMCFSYEDYSFWTYHSNI